MFQNLESDEKEIVIMAMEEKKFKPGDMVIEQGTDGDDLYVVEEGELDCSKLFVSLLLISSSLVPKNPNISKRTSPAKHLESLLCYITPHVLLLLWRRLMRSCGRWTDRPSTIL